MSNEEKIKKFMEEMNPEWGNLKKARYICNNLCDIYSYSPEFNYGVSELKDDILTEILKIINSKDEEEIKKLTEKDHQICIGVAAIYARLLKKAGLRKVEQLYGDVFFEIAEGRKTCVSISKELYRVKLKERPEGFEEELLDQIEEIDKELGFIDENGYRKNNYDVKDILDRESSFESRLQKVLDDRGRYISTVIGENLKNVELHKYYRYLMRTAFPNKRILIKPVDREYLKGIQYALIAEREDEDDEYLYYLYDREQGKFVSVKEEDIPKKDDEKELSI